MKMYPKCKECFGISTFLVLGLSYFPHLRGNSRSLFPGKSFVGNAPKVIDTKSLLILKIQANY